MQPTHAGAVVYQMDGIQKRFLVISSSNGRHWVLPKGHIEPGETPEQAALREILEEAGIVGTIVAPLPVQRFQKFDENVIAQYFLVSTLKVTKALEARTLRWEELPDAMALLSFDEARRALSEGAAILEHK